LRDPVDAGRLLLALAAGVLLAKTGVAFAPHANLWLVQLSITEPIRLAISATVLLALHLLFGLRLLTAFREYQLSYRLGRPSVTALDIGAATCLSAVCALVLSVPMQNRHILGLLVNARAGVASITAVILLIHALRLGLLCPLTKATNRLQGLSKEEASLLSEAPLLRTEDDTLGRTEFVRTLSSEIIRWTVTSSTQGTVFGLYGGWGQGKSSVMNFLYSELDAQHDHGILVTRHSPWRFVGPEALINGFGEELSHVMTGQLSSPSAGRSVLMYARSLVRQTSVGHLTLALPAATPVNSDVCDALSRALEDSGRYLVVLVDEVDRLEHDELVALFSLVRSSFSAPRVSFVLAMEPNTVLDVLGHSARSMSRGSWDAVTPNKSTTSDGRKPSTAIPRELLRPGVENAEGLEMSAHAWLDKVVAHPIYLPRIAPSTVEAMLHELLVTAGFAPASDDEFWKPIASNVAEYVVGLLRSPRQLKQFCISLGSAWQRSLNSDRVSHLNGHDLFFLEVIRMFFPRAANDMWENNGFYVDLENWLEIFRFSSIREDTSEHIREHILALCASEPNGFSLLGLLRCLFPKVDSATGNYPSATATPSESDYRERRISHPECFPFYFRGATEGELTPADIQRYVQGLNALDGNSSPEHVKEVVMSLLQMNEDRRKTIGLLKHSAADVRASVRQDLATVLIDHGCKSTREDALSWFLYAVDFEAPQDSDPSVDAAHLLARLPLLPRVVDVALFGTASCVELKRWTIEAGTVADATSREIERRLYDTSGLPMDMITEDFVDEQLGVVLMYWYEGWGLNSSHLEERLEERSKYLLSLATHNVGALVSLLRWYRPHDQRDTGPFNLHALNDHFGWQIVLKCVQIALETPVLTDGQRAALEALKNEILVKTAKSDESHHDDSSAAEGAQ
jgi:hypothetical protein